LIKLIDLLNEGITEQTALKLISDMIKRSPFKGRVFLAGGMVRDELLGLDPKDIDLVVIMDQGGIKFCEWLAKKLNIYKSGSNPVIFPKFGTAKVTLTGVIYNGVDLSKIDVEAVMPRTEKYTTGSRKPEVSYGTLKDDVERRDFTVNSLLKDLTTGEILDLTGMGKSDLQKGIVRTPLNPDVIFTDDPLRMLRAIRFTTKYGWKLPLFMIRSLKKNAAQLKNISSERIESELSKMLVTKNPAQAIRLLQITGLSIHIFPELDLLIGLKQNKYHKWNAVQHTLEVLKKVPPKLELRLAALFHDIGKPQTKSVIDGEIHFYEHEEVSSDIARDIMKRLRYPNEIINKVVFAIQSHMRLKGAGARGDIIADKALRKLQRDMGDHLEDVLELVNADNKSHADAYNMPDQVSNIRNRMKKLSIPKEKQVLPVNGNDIMNHLGIKKPGPIIGKLLSIVQDAVDENPKLKKQDALKMISKVYKGML